MVAAGDVRSLRSPCQYGFRPPVRTRSPGTAVQHTNRSFPDAYRAWDWHFRAVCVQRLIQRSVGGWAEVHGSSRFRSLTRTRAERLACNSEYWLRHPALTRLQLER